MLVRGVDDGNTVAEIDNKSTTPPKVTAVVIVGCRKNTLETLPDPDNTQIPVLYLLQNLVTTPIISDPLATSNTYGDIFVLKSGSLVTKTGGLRLFFDPGGRPRGFRISSIDAPSLVMVLSTSDDEMVVMGWWVMVDCGGFWWLNTVVGERECECLSPVKTDFMVI